MKIHDIAMVPCLRASQMHGRARGFQKIFVFDPPHRKPLRGSGNGVLNSYFPVMAKALFESAGH